MVGYSANGKKLSLLDPRGKQTSYGYDGFDRPLAVTQPDGSYEQLGYDAASNVLSRRTRGGNTIAFTYGDLDRPITKVVGATTISFGYDLVGRRTSVADAAGAIAFGYDTAGRNVSQTWPDGKALTYQVDAAGQRTRLTHPDGWWLGYRYDSMGRLTDIVEGTTRTLAHYNYDALSRRTQLIAANGVTSIYTWNADDRLNIVSHYKAGRPGLPIALTYTRNKVGQMTSVSVGDPRLLWRPAANDNTATTVNDLNQYLTVGAASLSYDPAGNLTGDGVVGYGYDEENRLVSATLPGHSASYAYDGLGRRGSKTVDGITTRYLQDGANEVAEYDGAGALLRRHVFGPGIDQPIVTIEANGTRVWHHADAIGSVVWQASNTGTDIQVTSYSPWGESTGTTGAFRFAGARFDAETGLVYLRNRMYSPRLGRFLQPDPIGTEGGLNLYAYAMNDPLNRIDPMGTCSTQPGGGRHHVGRSSWSRSGCRGRILGSVGKLRH